MSGYNTSEIALARDVVKHLSPDMLCIADRGFFGRDLWRQARETGADLLWRVRSDIDLPVETVLPDGSYLSNWHSYRSKRNKEQPIPVRVIEYRLGEHPDSGGTIYRMATSLLDPCLLYTSDAADE